MLIKLDLFRFSLVLLTATQKFAHFLLIIKIFIFVLIVCFSRVFDKGYKPREDRVSFGVKSDLEKFSNKHANIEYCHEQYRYVGPQLWISLDAEVYI